MQTSGEETVKLANEDGEEDDDEKNRNMLVEFGTSNAANVAYRNLNGFRLTPTDVLEMEFVL